MHIFALTFLARRLLPAACQKARIFAKNFFHFFRFCACVFLPSLYNGGMKSKESIFKVTFTNDSTVFIKAMDEEHAKRIVERNGTEWLSAELTVEMIIKKIEKVEG